MSSTNTRESSLRTKAAATVLVWSVFFLCWNLERGLTLVPGYRGLFETYGYTVPRSILSGAEIALVLLAVCLAHRIGPQRGLQKIGLRHPARRPAVFGLLAVAPMWIVFALTHRFSPDPAPELLYLSFISPLAEEVVYRGFLFGQLHRWAGWGRWPAIAASSLAFGYGHVGQADTLSEATGLLLLTGAGAAVFAWLFARWDTLIAPITLHVVMNLAWGLWQVGESALAGWVPFALQATTVVLAIVLTVLAGRMGWIGRAEAPA